MNLDNDPQHCGVCKEACLPGEVCSRGMCAVECGDGLTLCVDRCVDTDGDAENCGACARACELENAEAACSRGRCVVVGCADGFVNYDGLDVNGCECRVTQEVCNGLDDDCDGRVDEDEADGPDGSFCRCKEEPPYEFYSRPIMYQDQPMAGSLRCAETRCTREPDGSLLMEYCLERCEGGGEWPYALCEFARGDLEKFDANWSDEGGELEVRFCIEGGSVRGELNLWYGRHQYRRQLPLVSNGIVLSQGCYVRYFAPEQARTPGFQEIEPRGCRNQCGNDVAPDGGAGGEGGVHGGGGGGGDAMADCRFDLNQPVDGGSPLTPITIAAENCIGLTQGRVRVLSVRRLGSECRCNVSADCHDPARPVCESAASTPQCPRSTPSGVCSPERIDVPSN